MVGVVSDVTVAWLYRLSCGSIPGTDTVIVNNDKKGRLGRKNKGSCSNWSQLHHKVKES